MEGAACGGNKSWDEAGAGTAGAPNMLPVDAQVDAAACDVLGSASNKSDVMLNAEVPATEVLLLGAAAEGPTQKASGLEGGVAGREAG